MKTFSIRVKDFASSSLFQGVNDVENVTENNASVSAAIEIVSISSTEDVKPKIEKKQTKRKPRTPKSANKTLIKTPHTIGRRKAPLQYNYHKIPEYFQSTKKDFKIEPAAKPSTSSQVEEQPTNSGVKRYKLGLRQVKVVLRRLSVEQKVNTAQERKVDDSQMKISEFVECENIDNGYYKTHEQSTLPRLPMVHIFDTSFEQVKTEVEIDEVIPFDDVTSKDSRDSTTDKTAKENENGEETDDFNITKKIIRSSRMRANNNNTKKQPVKRKAKPECPAYKIIEGTKLAVDAFRYGDIDSVEHYFLSHFHADHYIGLKKSFSKKLYLSHITGRLVVDLIKVNDEFITCLEINKPIIVEEVEVTALDANHCPGAVMFLFKLRSGHCILHTGDFRASPDMEEYPEFWNNTINTIYLDTTYLTCKYEFPTQLDSISCVVEHCREFVKQTISTSHKPLVLCGAYKVGKEKIWLRIAQEFNFKVWIDEERQKVIHCIGNDEITRVITRDAREASIHVLPLGNISYQFIVKYMNQFGETFGNVLAIRPTGWEKKPRKPNFSNLISIVGIQYSEHSSYSELERFVRFLKPSKVISTVPFTSRNMEKTPEIPVSWMTNKNEPRKRCGQQNIQDFMVKSQTR